MHLLCPIAAKMNPTQLRCPIVAKMNTMHLLGPISIYQDVHHACTQPECLLEHLEQLLMRDAEDHPLHAHHIEQVQHHPVAVRMWQDE